MKIFVRVSLIVLAVTMFFAWTNPALAQGLHQDEIITGDDFILESGETLDGDLVSMGGDVILEEGSAVQGDLVSFGGSVNIFGRVDGDLVSFGDDVILHNTARITGDVFTLGGRLDQQEGARIDGQILTGIDLPFNLDLPSLSLPGMLAEPPRLQFNFSPLVDTLGFFFQTFLTAALAVLVVMFFPMPTARTARALTGQPVLSGGLGLLTMMIFPLILVALVLTLILIPVAIAGFLTMGVVLFFGWVAIGYELGDRLSNNVRQNWAPAVSAAVGTFLLSLVAWGIQRLVPCVGWVAPVMVAAVGLGAVLLTRFGTQDYQPAEIAQPLPPTVQDGSPEIVDVDGSIPAEQQTEAPQEPAENPDQDGNP